MLDLRSIFLFISLASAGCSNESGSPAPGASSVDLSSATILGDYSTLSEATVAQYFGSIAALTPSQFYRSLSPSAPRGAALPTLVKLDGSVVATLGTTASGSWEVFDQSFPRLSDLWRGMGIDPLHLGASFKATAPSSALSLETEDASGAEEDEATTDPRKQKPECEEYLSLVSLKLAQRVYNARGSGASFSERVAAEDALTAALGERATWYRENCLDAPPPPPPPPAASSTVTSNLPSYNDCLARQSRSVWTKLDNVCPASYRPPVTTGYSTTTALVGALLTYYGANAKAGGP